MQVAPVSAGPAAGVDAFGLDFQSLLRIVLTQLTYQDPLKPVDNFQFVSQLAQFTQIQQSETLNEQLTSLLAAQSASQATSLLGRVVDFQSNGAAQSGTVKSVSFTSGQPLLTVESSTGQVFANVSISTIATVR